MRYLQISSIVQVFTMVLLLHGQESHAQPFTLKGATDLVRIFEDGYHLPDAADSIVVSGLKGEVISAQLVIHSRKELTGVRVEVLPLRDAATGETLPADFISWNFVGTVMLSENAPNQPADVLVRKAPARFPEYLMMEQKANIPPKSYRSVWLTVSIPGTAEPGTYSGALKVSSDQGSQNMPFELTIYPLLMPEKRHLNITEWYTTGNFEKFHGIREKYSPEWFGMLRKYAGNMVAHRQNIFEVPINSVVVRRRPDGHFDFDFSRFDRIAGVFWDTGKMDYLETGEMTTFGPEEWFSTKILFRDFEVEDEKSGETVTIPGKEVLPHFLPALENHLRRMGWLEKTLFHIKDEPTLRNAQSWKEASSFVHRYAPDLTRMDAVETTFLLDDIEIAVPKLDHLSAWYDTYKKAPATGTGLWFYTVGIYQAAGYPNKTIDMPLSDSRIMHWLNYKFDLSGYLHWGWNQWYSDDPFENPGMHNGDGWHVYPARDGVMNSLRWEEMRNGIQDYEVFRMLEDKISTLKDSLGSRFSWIDPKQRSKEIIGEVVTDLLNHSGDPRKLYAARNEAIGEILDFDTSPRVYVQTIPEAVSGRVRARHIIEIFGWAEEGTRITVNGEEVTPDEHGMFLRNIGIPADTKAIVVEARKAQGRKTIVRRFTSTD